MPRVERARADAAEDGPTCPSIRQRLYPHVSQHAEERVCREVEEHATQRERVRAQDGDPEPAESEHLDRMQDEQRERPRMLVAMVNAVNPASP